MAHQAAGRFGIVAAALVGGSRLVEAGQGLLEASQAPQRVGLADQATGHAGLLTAVRESGLRLFEAGQGLLEASQAGEHAGAVHHAVGSRDMLAAAREDGLRLLKADESLLEAAQAGQRAGAAHGAAGRRDLLAESRVEAMGLCEVGQGVFVAAQCRQAVPERLGDGRPAWVLRAPSDLGLYQGRELRQVLRLGVVGPVVVAMGVARSQMQRGREVPAFSRLPWTLSVEDVLELGVGAGADVVTQLLIVHAREFHVSPLLAPTKEPPPASAPSAAGEAAAWHKGGARFADFSRCSCNRHEPRKVQDFPTASSGLADPSRACGRVSSAGRGALAERATPPSSRWRTGWWRGRGRRSEWRRPPCATPGGAADRWRGP